MVRETRHLWVGNLPENIREDRIREHFKRYGRVQSVKLLPRGEECPVDGGSSSSLGEGNEGGSGSSSGGGGGGSGGSSTSGGASATVAFMDIKSAAKAHATEHTLDERALTTQYYEPQHLQHRFPSHGSSEDHGSSGVSGGGSGSAGGVSGGGGGSGSTGVGVGGGGGGGGERGERGSESFDSRGSHGSFYGSERSNRVVGTGSSGVVGGGGSGGGGVGVGSHPADSSTGDPGGYISRGRPPPSSSYHVTSSRARDRLYPRTSPYVSGPPPPPHLDRHRGSLPPSSWSTYEATSSRYGGAPPPPSPATNDAYQDEQGNGGGGGNSSSALRQHKKQRRKSRSGSSSPSGSSRSGSSSSSRSGSSGGSTSGGSTSPGSSPHRTSNVAVTEDRRPLAICVRNLPTRSSDTSLKDGLFHEYKKHGKVTWVKVVGTAGDRYALVCFKKPEDVEKALEVSQDKLFFGCKIEVAPYQGYDVEDNEFRPYEAELDEYHPKATRTLFIGNLEKDVTSSELRKHFEPFGEIIEIDIKKQGAVSSYAFCQYSDIGSVVKAMRSMDGEHLGANRIKLGFGKSMPTSCVWVDGINDSMSEKYLNMHFHQFGPITQTVIDRERGHALVFFEQINFAQAAVKEMRGTALRGRRLQVDFASRECQETFYEHLERQGNVSEKTWDSRPSPASTFDVTIPSRRERSSFDSAVTVSSSSSRFTRYDTPPRSRTASYSRTSGSSTPGASPAHPTAMSRSGRRSYQDSYYDGDYTEPASRRFRSYDEFSQGSGASHDDYQSSVLSDGKLNDDDCPPPSRRHAVQSVVTSVDPPAPPPPLLPPPDIRHLQKERVHLLEQLEECHSSGDEVGFPMKKRAKLDSSSTTILCEDDEPEIASLLVTSHSTRKGMDFRRVSDSKVVVHHSTRRSSCENRVPGPCKRRRDATSRHHEHHDGSRPGTPLVDERPENLVPSEPRRFRERSHEGPLSLPLPRFAAQMLNNNNNTSSSNNNTGSGTRSSSASLAKVASPPCASLSTAPSPRAAPQPPASPPPRHTSSSPTSSDSETAPQSPSLEERIRSLDEKYEKWSGSRALSAAGGDALAKLDASASERFRIRHKLLDLDLRDVKPSDIVKSVLAKRSVFDEDSKRLENFSEKYEPREFTGVIGVSSMIGSTAGLTTSGCTSKVCLQYPFPSHPPTSGTSITSQIGINTSLSASLTPTTTVAPSMLKTDPRMVQHNCIHPTPATPITPGTSIKTVSPELPPVSLPIGLGSGTAASSGNGSGLASASSLLSSNGNLSNIHTLGASTHRGLSISATTASPTVTAASTDAFSTAITTTVVPVTTLSATISSSTATTTTTTTTTTSVTGAISSMTTTSSIAPSSSITSSSNSSSSLLLSTSSTDLPRSRLKKEMSGSSRESRDSRDGKESRESKHGKGKDCQRRSRKEEVDAERNRKEKDERESSNVANDIGNTHNTDNYHSKDFKDNKDNKELRYERKEREEKERREKEDRERQERRDKEDRDRQEKKEREERERREKDEERRERERLDKERQEKDRREREERERERKEREENELKEKERREKERIDRERREREEKERQERREREERERREREERERKERELRLEREKQEKERLRREREEQERREKEERDRRREEKERLERERKREREEKERLERERRKEKEERDKMEKEKREKEERERLEKLEKEKHEREKRREREDQERREKEKAEREKRRDREEKDKEKREREDSRRQSTENHLHPSVTQSQSQVAPAPVPIKRRCSSQDGPDDDGKRVKLSDHRRDSKDRSRQNRRSEDRKHRNDSHRSSRESRESRDSKESGSATQDSRDGTHGESNRENNSKDNSGNKEKQRSKKNRSEKESRERSPRVSHESDKEFLSRLELSKRNNSSPSTEQTSVGSNHTRDAQQHHQQQQSALNSHSDMDDGPLSTHEIQVARNPSATDTDSDEPKKHSIFDIVDDEPAYISMYDKVKARSTKNMQKLEEEKRQVRLKDKFSQLKQSRARREEKKQSASWDGDSVSSKALTEDEATSESDSTRTKSLSRKGSRSRIHSDTSEEEEPFNNKVRKSVKTERFLESDVDLGFADTEEKQNPLEASNVIVNSVHTNVKEEPRTSDEDERIGFRANHPAIVVNNHERDSRKKSHKKKQKRQKNSISSEDNLKAAPTENLEHKKANVITSNADCRPNHATELSAATTIVATALDNAEERMRADKKQRSKKEKRRDRNGEDKAKARRKRLNRQEARDSQRMEDIFGPLSDDVDDGPSNTFFNRFNNLTSENSAYASDSDGGRSSLDMDRVRRKTEKKRRHQPEDENSVDLAEAGREIEAKLLSMPSSPKTAPACTESNDHDVFRFTDDNDSIEPSTPSTVPEKVKEKKKKRKKSKEERSRKDYHHHHHHHHHHHEKSGELPYLGAEPSPPRASSPLVPKTISPSLPTPREALLSPIPKVTSNVTTVSSITPPVVSTIQTPKPEKKKDKFIPGFGIEIDETIHENAVKSISEPEERDGSCQSRSGREELPEVPVPTTPPAQNEDKPRVAISQEETEDAVAALLEETFGASTEDFSYEGEEEEAEADGVAGASAEAPQEDVEEMQQAVESLNASTVEGDADLKPDTPQSEHDLQIDTDTEEDPNYETVDLTQPPKTPDIPSFYKSPTKTLSMAPGLTTPEKPVEVRLPLAVAKPESSPSSVIAHSWNLNEHNKPRESIKPVQLDTIESDADVASPERTAQARRASASPPSPQYKQPMLVPCGVPITPEAPKTLSAASSRPSPITVQPLYQRLPVSPQSQMVPMRQASPKLQNVTTVSSSSNTTPLPPLVPSRMPPLVPSQPSPRVSQPLSPNGQWSRNPTLSPHVPNVGKRKPSPPPTKIAVCVPIPAHRPEAPVQQIYSTAATQQPVIQHASGMLAPAPGYPRGGLPPLTLNIPPRPYMPVPPLASGIQVKSSRDSSLGGKSVIETLLPVNPNEPPQRLEEPKLSPAVIPEPTNKASTSPKVPSPNQPPTYIPETAKIEINASTSSPVFGKPAYVTDSYTMSSRTQKQISVSITTDSNLLSPRQKQEVSNLQLLTTHVPRSSTPSPVIVAHGQPHLIHKSVHTLGPPTVSSPNQPLIKTVVPVVPQQATPNVPSSLPSDKCIIPQTPITCQRQSPVSQSQLVKSHVVPLVSTVSQTIISRVVPSTVSSISTPPMTEQSTPECLETRVIQEKQLELDAEAQIGQTVQPMQLTPPIETTQQVDEIKQEPVEVKQEDTADETKYNVIESEKPVSQSCVEDDIKTKQEKQEVIKTEVAPCVPKAEVADVVAPKLETETPIKLEPANDVKEEDAAKENDETMELDEVEPAEDPLKEPSTDPLAIDSKEDPTDSKEDSDYWSAKEVNIESVIKKVDALCDGEGNDGDDEAQQADSANSDSHDTSKNESDWFDVESTEGESKKSFVSAEDHDESVETCENESTRSRRGRTKSRRGSRGGVTTRRGGRNASTVSHRRGGRSPRGSKHHVEKNKLPADVYEFHDDSEEDNAGRPRLILTIKSPGPNVTGTNAQPATPVAAVKEVPPEEFVSPAANTRKSRRLAERDGSRNTVDDVIEDVVRGSPVNKLMSGNTGNVHATRRSTRHNNAPRNTTQPPAVQLTELRKSPRGSRKAARRTSENNDDSGEEKTKEVAAAPQESPNKEEPKLTQPESPKAEESAQAATPAPQKTVSLEPMTLIDPVTGMLIPMRESEEGQYIPVSTTSGQAQNTTNRTLCESRSGGLISASPTNEAPRAKAESALPAPAEPKKEAVVEHTSCQPSQQVQPQTSVITKPQSPAVQVTSTITVAQSSATSTTIVTNVTVTATPTTAAAQPVLTSSSQTKPTSFKAHVLNASKLVTSSQQQQVVITKPAPSLPNQTIVQNIVKPPAQAIQGLNLQIPPSRVVSPSLSPRAKQAAQLAPANAKQGQPMSPVLNNTGAPPNPKQHLLQAAKQQTSTIVNMSQKMPINMHSANVNVTTSSPRIHQPVSQPTALKGINGQPHPLNPKTHLLQAAVPIVTVVSSPTQPHLVNPQPISTGVSNVRPPGSKAPITGTMESQKVEVPMSGCIMVPTASPQSRNVPMPTYETPLHGSTGATPPGGQYGLVPPHRSQSPPLPPPAHHHSNTSQSEVVNHYGALGRGGELPHYLHPQMLQYQYLRAQQEALTAPRIAYHIPGTRSPHLPLDPKHDTGIEDSHSPPLELRRGTRTPQDRTTDSPQVAQVYMLHSGVRLPPPPPQYNAGNNPSLPAGARAGYYEPPPAHLRSQYPMAASEAPPEMGRATTPERCRKHQDLTPPYASQVPPQADSFQMLLQRYPVMWQGLLALKNDQAAVQMHFVFGNPNVARDSLPCNSDGSTPPLRIAQRMRLEQTQVEGVARKMQTDNEHCMLLALPCGRDEVDVLQQSKNLQTGFIMYLQQKQAAGIVNIAAPGSQQPAYVVHIFPSCDFAHENLARIAPDLLHRVAKIAHLLIVIATV